MAVSFPKLGLELVINRVAFYLGSFPVYWYAICIAIGAILGVLYGYKLSKREGIHEDALSDVVLSALLLGFIGARLYYVLFKWDYFSQNLGEIFNIRDGGIAIYGGILAGALGIVLCCKYKKIPLFPVLDIGAVSLLIAQGIGRWGNFFNQEAFGRNTTSIFGMYSESTKRYLTSVQSELGMQGIIVDASQPVHPCFFYESLWCILGAILLGFYSKHKKFKGEIACLYAVWYGIGRFFIEGLRTDSLMIGRFRVSQLVAVACVAIGGGILLYGRRKTLSIKASQYR